MMGAESCLASFPAARWPENESIHLIKDERKADPWCWANNLLIIYQYFYL